MSGADVPEAVDLSPGQLTLHWPREAVVLSAQTLRAHCQCTACRRTPPQAGAWTDGELRLVDITPVGNYGVQLHFSDGHERGIFPWVYLQQLARQTPA